jgi:hypothetical protein
MKQKKAAWLPFLSKIIIAWFVDARKVNEYCPLMQYGHMMQTIMYLKNHLNGFFCDPK